MALPVALTEQNNAASSVLDGGCCSDLDAGCVGFLYPNRVSRLSTELGFEVEVRGGCKVEVGVEFF